ncbi:MAG: M28 family peptidase, partial [Candidatus Thorarchaeota archaeon]
MNELWNNVDSERIYKHILRTEGEKHPLFSPEKMEECADYILSEFENYGLTTNIHTFKVDGSDYTFRNIEGSLGDSKDSELLIVSHYDTVRHSPGANDNGSAIGVMLEAARVLSEADFKGGVRFVSFNLEEGNPEFSRQLRETALKLDLTDEHGRYTSWRTDKTMKRFRKAVLKQIDAGKDRADAVSLAIKEMESDLQEHELALLRENERLTRGLTRTNWPGRTALLGSSAWVENANQDGKNIIGVLCLETMGYTSTAKNSQKFPDEIDPSLFTTFGTQDDLTVGDFLTIISDKNSGALADSFCEQSRRESIALPFACLKAPLGFEEAAHVMPDLLRSDHAPFWRENIPALLLTDSANFRYPFYHTHADTIDKLDFDILAKICKATIATATHFRPPSSES